MQPNLIIQSFTPGILRMINIKDNAVLSSRMDEFEKGKGRKLGNAETTWGACMLTRAVLCSINEISVANLHYLYLSHQQPFLKWRQSMILYKAKQLC